MTTGKQNKTTSGIEKIYTNPEELSNDITLVYSKYKSLIDSLIKGNYGIQNEADILKLFKNIGVEFSGRNNELLTLLKEKYGLNFLKDLDFSGGLKISKNELNNQNNNQVRSFFEEDYVLQKGDNIFSRGYGYHLNFEGFNKIDVSNHSLNGEVYFGEIKKYYNDTIKALNYYKGMRCSDLSELDKKIVLILFEHYKNILYFFQNILITFSDKDYLIKTGVNISERTFNKYFKYNELKNSDNYIDTIKIELEKIIFIFSDLLLNIKNNNVIDFDNNLLKDEIFEYFSNFFKDSYDLQENIIDGFKNQKSSKNTDINGIEKLIKKSNTKLILRAIRIIREEDNPIKQLFSCFNTAKGIPKGIEHIDINGLLYGGIEMPYFMKYILTRFYNKKEENLDIDLVLLSNYHNRNLKKVSGPDNYPNIQDKHQKRVQIVLDDNLYYGSTIQHANSLIMEKGPVLTGVTEVGLRRGELGKLNEGAGINILLSEVSRAASATPIFKNKPGYINMTNSYIKRRLPNLIGKY